MRIQAVLGNIKLCLGQTMVDFISFEINRVNVIGFYYFNIITLITLFKLVKNEENVFILVELELNSNLKFSSPYILWKKNPNLRLIQILRGKHFLIGISPPFSKSFLNFSAYSSSLLKIISEDRIDIPIFIFLKFIKIDFKKKSRG